MRVAVARRPSSRARSGPSGSMLPGHDLVGIQVDRGVRIDQHVAPDAPVRLGEAGHRRHQALVGALDQVRRTACRAAAPRTRPSRRGPRRRSACSRAAASAPDGRSARGSPRGSCRATIFQFAGWWSCHAPLRLEAARCRSARAARAGPPPARRAACAWMSRFTKTRPQSVSTRAGNRPSVDLSRPGIERPSGTPISSPSSPVGPAVVEAADRLAALARAAQQARAAVAADVAEGAQLAVLVAQHEHGLRAGVGGEVVAGLRQLRHVRRRAARCGRRSAAARAPRSPGRGRGAARAAASSPGRAVRASGLLRLAPGLARLCSSAPS